MEGSQQPKAKAGVTGVFNLVPAGVLQRRRRYVAGRFPLGHPSFSSGDYLLGVDPQSTSTAAKQRDSGQAASQPPPALVISNKQQQQTSSGPGKQLQGLPRTDAGNNYFVLMKAGRDFCVYPLDTSYTFKPIVRSTIQSVDELELAQKQASAAASGAGGAGGMFMPKSVRQAMQREAAAAAADRDLKEEALPILKDKVAELAVKYGSAPTGREKLLLDAVSEDESSDDMGALEQDDDDLGAARRGGRGRGRKGQADRPAEGKQAGQAGGSGGGADGGGNPDDELAEDIYAGEEDELRPMRPTEDVDWEFAEEAADDDLEQGASDEEGLDDDPGYRKELGLEGDEEDEDEKAKQEKLAQEAEAAEQAAAAKEAAGAAEGAAADADEDMLDVDENEFDADDLDKLAEERERNGEASPAIKKRKRSVTPPGVAVAAAIRSSTPSGRRATTPPTAAVTAAATGRAATPPLGAATKAAVSRKTPPPAARRGTPPPAAGISKRKRDEGAALAALPAAAAGAGATAAAAVVLAPWEWTADQLDAGGVPTTDGIIQALTHMGPVPTEQLQLLQDRLNLAQIGNDGKTLLKKRLLQVAKVGIIGGRKYMVLK